MASPADLKPKNMERVAITELSASLGNKGNSTSFPGDLNLVDHWMVFRIVKQKLLRKNDVPLTSDIHRVYLPLPVQLQTGYAQNYASGGLGATGQAAAAAAPKAESMIRGLIDSAQKKGVMDTAKSAGKSLIDAATVDNAIDLGAEAGAIATSVGVNAVQNLGGPIGRGAIAGLVVTVNPYLAMVYESPTLRTHEFSWKLVAKNFKESEAIYAIIKLFKYHSAPRISKKLGHGISKHLLDYPEQFDIDFHHDNYLYNIGPTVMINLSVNYHPDGILYHVKDDSGNRTTGPLKLPVSVQLSCTFQDVSIVTKDEINNENR